MTLKELRQSMEAQVCEIQSMNQAIAEIAKSRDKLIDDFQKKHGLTYAQFQNVYESLRRH